MFTLLNIVNNNSTNNGNKNKNNNNTSDNNINNNTNNNNKTNKDSKVNSKQAHKARRRIGTVERVGWPSDKSVSKSALYDRMLWSLRSKKNEYIGSSTIHCLSRTVKRNKTVRVCSLFSHDGH